MRSPPQSPGTSCAWRLTVLHRDFSCRYSPVGTVVVGANRFAISLPQQVYALHLNPVFIDN